MGILIFSCLRTIPILFQHLTAFDIPTRRRSIDDLIHDRSRVASLSSCRKSLINLPSLPCVSFQIIPLWQAIDDRLPRSYSDQSYACTDASFTLFILLNTLH